MDYCFCIYGTVISFPLPQFLSFCEKNYAFGQNHVTFCVLTKKVNYQLHIRLCLHFSCSNVYKKRELLFHVFIVYTAKKWRKKIPKTIYLLLLYWLILAADILRKWWFYFHFVYFFNCLNDWFTKDTLPYFFITLLYSLTCLLILDKTF